MRYIFPFRYIMPDSRIIIYGASQTGYDFYRQVKSTGYCKIVLWVDGQYLWWREMGLPVDPPGEIAGKVFDTIILTAETEPTAKSMTDDLLMMGIPYEKIFWQDDYSIRENIVKGYDEERVRREAKEAALEDPLKYVNENTLDIVVRMMYAKDVLLNRDSDAHRNMYRKLMVNQMNGKEPTEDMVPAYFTEYALKRGWKAFDQSFHELISSMRERGFDRNRFIPVDSDGGLLNGRHRLAAAMALGISVYTREYGFKGFHRHYDAEWLREVDFSGTEIGEVVEECNKLKDVS